MKKPSHPIDLPNWPGPVVAPSDSSASPDVAPGAPGTRPAPAAADDDADALKSGAPSGLASGFTNVQTVLRRTNGIVGKLIVEMETNGLYAQLPEGGWEKVEAIEERVRDVIVSLSVELKNPPQRGHLYACLYPDWYPLSEYGWPDDQVPNFSAVEVSRRRDFTLAQELEDRGRLFSSDFITVGALLLTKRASTADIALEVERNGIWSRYHHNAPRHSKIDWGGGLAFAGGHFRPLSEALDSIGADVRKGIVSDESKFYLESLTVFGWPRKHLPRFTEDLEAPSDHSATSDSPFDEPPEAQQVPSGGRKVVDGSLQQALEEPKLIMALWNLLIKQDDNDNKARFPNQAALIQYLETNVDGLKSSSVFAKVGKVRDALGLPKQRSGKKSPR